MAGEKILVVDDNEINLKMTRLALQTEGYDVRTARDAEEALSALADFQPRLILMDIQLPGMDGLSLTKRLKTEPKTKDVLIAAMTAYAMKGDEEKALADGCDGYIPKPIDTRHLPDQIAKMIGRHEDTDRR